MDLDPDTLDAIESDAYVELGLELGWGDDDDGTRDLKHDIVNALVPFIARHIARATAGAIADKIEQRQKYLYRATVHHRKLRADEAAAIARAHGRTPETAGGSIR